MVFLYREHGKDVPLMASMTTIEYSPSIPTAVFRSNLVWPVTTSSNRLPPPKFMMSLTNASISAKTMSVL
jgi:hypothetical protein